MLRMAPGATRKSHLIPGWGGHPEAPRKREAGAMCSLQFKTSMSMLLCRYPRAHLLALILLHLRDGWVRVGLPIYRTAAPEHQEATP